MKIHSLLLLAFCLSPFVESTHASESSRVAATLLNTWRDADVSVLAKPENAEALEMLRKKALSSTDPAARVVLLNFGDPAIVTWWLAQMTSDDVRDRERAFGAVPFLRNPALILALEPVLLREESTQDILISDDYASTPPSVIAAASVMRIVRDNPEFPKELKAWFLSLKSNDARRTAVRKWVAENRNLLKSGQFSELKPLK